MLLADSHCPSVDHSLFRFITTLATVENLALELPEHQRATLAMHILDSLPGLFSEADSGLAEAVRRDAELDENPAIGLSLGEFDQKILSRRARCPTNHSRGFA